MTIILFSFTSNAQGLRVGGTIGIPSGGAETYYSFVYGLDLSYTWNLAEKFDLGIVLNYTQFSPDNGTYILPAGIAGRFDISQKFSAGLDLGYNIGPMNTGFYYRPLIGYNLSETIQITTSYRANRGTISSYGSNQETVFGPNLNSINIGFNFKLL